MPAEPLPGARVVRPDGRAEPGAGGGPGLWLSAARELDAWMAERDYAGYDPHDFLASPFLRATTLGSRWVGVAWTQLGKRLPIQLRPLLGVPRMRNAKGIGLVLGAKVRLAESTGEERYRAEAAELVGWLARDDVVRDGGWGYPFPWSNRDFKAPAGTPSSVATAFVGHALLDAADRLGLEDAGELAASGGRFLLERLNRIEGPDGTFCFSYTPLDRRAVHNANLMAASLLARLHGRDPDDERAEAVRSATRFTLNAQTPAGAWPYGPANRNGWIDSFHTGYILLALDEIGRRVEVPGIEEAIEAGIAYWRAAFFGGPAVGYGPGEAYPVHAHAVAQAILTFTGLRHRIGDGLEEAERLAGWALDHMRSPAGCFHYLRGRRRANTLPYMRWVQAWMLLALSELALATHTDQTVT